VQLATFLLEAGSADQALPVIEGAIRFDQQSLPAHSLLGDAYRLLGRFPEAKSRFEWVLGRDASLPMVHYNLGLLYLFAPSIPGMTPMQQVDAATASLKKFQELRSKGRGRRLRRAAQPSEAEARRARGPASCRRTATACRASTRCASSRSAEPVASARIELLARLQPVLHLASPAGTSNPTR
jgi:tetratricopeptide (TPR) repeat protein